MGNGPISGNILKTVFVLGLFTLAGEVGTQYSPHITCLVATQATLLGKDVFPFNKYIHPLHGFILILFIQVKYCKVTFPTGCLNVWVFKERIRPVGGAGSAKCILPGKCPSLSAVTDGTSILLYRVLVQESSGMKGMWLGSILHSGIFDTRVA